MLPKGLYSSTRVLAIVNAVGVVRYKGIKKEEADTTKLLLRALFYTFWVHKNPEIFHDEEHLHHREPFSRVISRKNREPESRGLAGIHNDIVRHRIADAHADRSKS